MEMDLRAFEKTDIWPLPDTSLGVRPALQQILNPEEFRTQGQLVGGYTARLLGGSNVHYLVIITSDNNAHVLIVNDQMDQLFDVTIGKVGLVPVVTFAVVEREILIASPAFPTQWGILGGAVKPAIKVDSLQTSTSAIDIPRGICVSWQGRCVIADGTALYISDPLFPRTFVAPNVIGMDGYIHGLDVTAAGDLLISTTAGLFLYNGDAAATGQVAIGNMQKVTDYFTQHFRQTAFSQGVMWGLSPVGFRVLQAGNRIEEIQIAMTTFARVLSGDKSRYNVEDCFIFPSKWGPIIQTPFAICLLHSALRRVFWWTNTGEFVGTLEDEQGHVLLLTSVGVLRPYGSGVDYNLQEVTGVAAGVAQTPVKASPTVRFVDVNTDAFEDVSITVNGVERTVAPPQSSSLFGTAVWDVDSWGAAMMQHTHFDLAERTREVRFEVAIPTALSRIGNADVTLRGQSPERTRG